MFGKKETLPTTETRQTTPFVGRETELEFLQNALARVLSTKQPKFIFLEGDFGVGKTTLINHFLEEMMRANPDMLSGKGICATETEMSGLVPFGQLLDSLKIRLTPDKWVEFIKNVAPAWIDIFTFNIIGNTIKTIEEGKKLLGRSSYRQENVFVQYINALLQIVKKQPLIAVLDDLQWADASSLDLLAHLARNLNEAAILFICVYRPDAKQVPRFSELYAKLRRDGMASELIITKGVNVAEYISQRYRQHTFPAEIIGQIQRITQGHPLFLSQLLSLWQETGVIVAETLSDGSQSWTLTNTENIQMDIPENMQAVLAQRLGLLADEPRKLISFAAVQGEEFTAQVMRELGKWDEYTVYDYLESLENRHTLIAEKETQEIGETVFDIYRFVHRFLRDYIYDQLSSGKQRFLHRAIGECLEKLHQSNLYPVAGELARHFDKAHQPRKAAKYALIAAQFEQARYAWKEGEDWCEFGLSLLEDGLSNEEVNQLRLDLLDMSGDGYYKRGKYPLAAQRYSTALTLARGIQTTPEKIAELSLELADAYYASGLRDEVPPLLEEIKQIFTEYKNTFQYGELHVKLEWFYARQYARLGMNAVVIESLLQLLEKAEKLPCTLSLNLIIARIYNRLGISFRSLNQYHEAEEYYRKAIQLLEYIGEKGMAAGFAVNLANLFFLCGEFEKSSLLASQAFIISSQIGDLDNMEYSKARRGRFLLSLGKVSEAIQELEMAKSFNQQSGLKWDVPSLYADLSLAYLASDEFERAYQYAVDAVKEATQNKDKEDLGYAHEVLGQVEAKRQNWVSVEQYFNRAFFLFEECGNRHFVAISQYHFAEALFQQGEKEEAVTLLHKALNTFQQLHLEHEITKTQTFLEKIETGGE